LDLPDGGATLQCGEHVAAAALDGRAIADVAGMGGDLGVVAGSVYSGKSGGGGGVDGDADEDGGAVFGGGGGVGFVYWNYDIDRDGGGHSGFFPAGHAGEAALSGNFRVDGGGDGDCLPVSANFPGAVQHGTEGPEAGGNSQRSAAG